MPIASRVLTAAAASTALVHTALGHIPPTGAVDCGGHYADYCAACPEGQGPLWCNGECLWLSGDCIKPSMWQRFKAWTIWSFWHYMYHLPHILCIGAVMGCYAAIYNKRIVEELPQESFWPVKPDFDDWKDREVGLFDCFKEPSQLIWSIFCTPVIAAKNYQVGRVMPFWPACTLIFCGMFSFFWPFFLLMTCVRTGLSYKLQRNLRLKPNIVEAFFLSIFCFPCEIGRESIEVNKEIGVDIQCAFEIEKSLSAKFEIAAETVAEGLDRTCHRVCS